MEAPPQAHTLPAADKQGKVDTEGMAETVDREEMVAVET